MKKTQHVQLFESAFLEPPHLRFSKRFFAKQGGFGWGPKSKNLCAFLSLMPDYHGAVLDYAFNCPAILR